MHIEPLFLSSFPSSADQHSDLSSGTSVLPASANMVSGGLISPSGIGRPGLDLELKVDMQSQSKLVRVIPRIFLELKSSSLSLEG